MLNGQVDDRRPPFRWFRGSEQQKPLLRLDAADGSFAAAVVAAQTFIGVPPLDDLSIPTCSCSPGAAT